MPFKKLVTEADLLAYLQGGQLRFPPLQIVTVQTNVTSSRGTRLDALLTMCWRDRTYRFGAEVRRLWTPKAVTEAVETARRNASTIGVSPLVLVPYLGEERLRALEEEGVSGIDLCGNGIVVVPGELLVLRTGFANRFRWEGTIKNVYRKSSSIVARAFLLVPEFESVTELLEEIRRRGGEVTLATVSKVCKTLEADLVIERGPGRSSAARPPAPQRPGAAPRPPRVRPSPFLRLRLLQPAKLLDLLAQNCTPPAVSRTFRGKYTLPPEELPMRLAGWEGESGGRAVLTGASSVQAYAVMAREPMQSIYCSDIEKAVIRLGSDLRETDRFANVTLLETQDDFVYFDRRPGLVASPVQSYLELLVGDKRERETADQVRRVILGPLAPGSQEG